jgi:hypothetical protein
MTTDIQQATPSDGDEVGPEKALDHRREAEHDLARAQADEERARTNECRALREIEEAAKEVEHADRPNENHWIVVNGDRRVVHGECLTFEEIVKIAYPVPPPGTDVQFTVQYTRGPETKPAGTLIEGQSVKIQDGMEFDVTPTNRS